MLEAEAGQRRELVEVFVAVGAFVRKAGEKPGVYAVRGARSGSSQFRPACPAKPRFRSDLLETER